MKNRSLKFLLFLMLTIGCGSCKSNEDAKNEMPQIVFMEENHYGSENGSGKFIDNEGNIYAFDLQDEPWMDIKEKYARLVEKYLNAEKKPEIAGQVDMDTLEACYRLVKKASASERKLSYKELKEDDAVYGYYEWTAFRYKRGKLQAITVYRGGDVQIVNKDRYIKKAVDAIKKMLPLEDREEPLYM